ncbi:hypothetical protein O7606_04200 [Micromonospora sp. WMMD882]|uniref:hypothetical protein n=1 Tax=Micromonospora sp. WMMD882 TaxID=3015151 RepID=UPI00248CDFAC|nr:hypothetical protein [Micromonospora sp. WMMD882]WBB80599.1 hypothetical protein O7606_04200 [Micromonospora sp. WMMD882]
MSAAGPPRELRRADLGELGDELGSGGQAVVHDLPGLTLPDAPGRLVYKEYRPGLAPRARDMHDLIALRANLDEPERRRLDACAAWPLRVVGDDRGIRGVLLPRIPDSFFQPVTLPSGRRREIPREAQHLFVDADRCRRIGMPTPTPRQRLRICRDFAAALAFLHGPPLDVVFGDLNAKNELFRLDAEPTVLLVDCDAVRVRGSVTGSRQLDAPDWAAPEAPDALSRHTDLYKLGLFVLRCLTPGTQASTRTDPAYAAGALDPGGVALLTAALTGPPAKRPTAEEWLRHLSWALGEPLTPPTLDRVTPDRTLVPAGATVTVRWVAHHADTVEVGVPGGDAVRVDGRAGAGSVRLRPTGSGPLRVLAGNRRGVTEGWTPPVAVLDASRWTDLPVPMPHVPWPDGWFPALPDLGPALAGAGPRVDEDPPPSLVAAPPPLVALTGTDDPPPGFPTPVPAPVPRFDVDGGPVDVVSILTAGPDLDFSPPGEEGRSSPPGGAARLFRRGGRGRFSGRGGVRLLGRGGRGRR